MVIGRASKAASSPATSFGAGKLIIKGDGTSGILGIIDGIHGWQTGAAGVIIYPAYRTA